MISDRETAFWHHGRITLAGKPASSASALVRLMTSSVSHFVDKVWMICRIDFWQHAREDLSHASQSEVL